MGLEIGCLHVRRSILIQAAPKRVWREFETFERIAAWLDRGHQLHAFEPRTGGNADFSVEIDGKEFSVRKNPFAPKIIQFRQLRIQI